MACLPEPLALVHFFPFVLWPLNGWANVVTSVGYLILFVWQGYFYKKRIQKPKLWNNPLVSQIPFIVIYSIATYILYPIAISFN